jgi:O-methyltransferase domain
MPNFDYYGRHEESSKPFNEFVATLSGTSHDELTKIVPWAECEGRRVVDAGGAVRGGRPRDQAVVSHDRHARARPARGRRAGPRGAMFDALTYPPNVSAVMLKDVLHDWDDDDACRKILAACHSALPENGKVLGRGRLLAGPRRRKGGQQGVVREVPRRRPPSWCSWAARSGRSESTPTSRRRPGSRSWPMPRPVPPRRT